MREHTIYAKSSNYLVSINGDVYSLGERPGHLKPIISNWGYARVGYYCKVAKKSHHRRIHRIVAGLFLEGPKLPQVNHKDGNKLNNRLENLEWATNSSNQKHAYALGLNKASTAPKPALHKLGPEERAEAKRLRAEGLSYIKIGKLLGASNGTIRRICLDIFKY